MPRLEPARLPGQPPFGTKVLLSVPNDSIRNASIAVLDAAAHPRLCHSDCKLGIARLAPACDHRMSQFGEKKSVGTPAERLGEAVRDTTNGEVVAVLALVVRLHGMISVDAAVQ